MGRSQNKLVVFAGLPGSGKSTLARLLARNICATYLRIDSLEQAIRHALPATVDIEAAGYSSAYAIAREKSPVG